VKRRLVKAEQGYTANIEVAGFVNRQTLLTMLMMWRKELKDS